MTNIAKHRQPKFLKKFLVMFFRQKYEEYGIAYGQCDFFPKKVKLV